MSNLLCSIRAFQRKMAGRRIGEREKELSKENDDKLKSILDNIVEKFTSN